MSDLEEKLHNGPSLQGRDPRASLALPVGQDEAACESALSAQECSQNQHVLDVVYKRLLPFPKWAGRWV